MSLRPYQVPHAQLILSSLQRWKSVLDASDTGTGKTYVSLWICKLLGVVPFVIGPVNAEAGWQAAAEAIGVQIQYVNYEKLRGRRKWGLARCPICPETRTPFFGPFRERKPAETEWTIEVPWGKGSFIRWKEDYCCIIADEVHRCGGESSLQSKLLIAARRQAEYVLCLSATAADDPRQMKALGYTLGLHGLSKKSKVLPDYRGWLLRHGCTPGIFGGFDFSLNDEKQYKAFQRMNAEIFPAHGARMRKAEIPGFPKTVLDVLLLADETGKAAKLAEELHGLDGEKVPDLAAIQKCKQGLELLKVSHLVDAVKDYALTSKVAIFLNYTAPLEECLAELRKIFGNDRVGILRGGQTSAERKYNLDTFQANRFDAIIGNAQASGESGNMHDPTGEVERTVFMSPVESGRQYKQIQGRVHRDGGAFSLQLVAMFKGTYEEKVATRMKRKEMNVDLFNDADLLV